MRLTVIGTFHRRHGNSLPLLKRLYVDSVRKPDESLLMCEDQDDVDALLKAYDELHELELLDGWPEGLHVLLEPTPSVNGKYQVIPYAHKINTALTIATGDAIVYLDNGSDPKPLKYKVMLEGLEQNPDWGAVYCTQQRTGFQEFTALADTVVLDGFCAVNYTQVMHRRTPDRWPLDLRHADPDMADGIFWRSLHESIGSFYPVGGDEILDEHQMDSASVKL